MKPHLPTLRGSLTPPLSLTLSLSLLSLLSLSLQIMDLWCRRTVVRGATALSSARCPLNSHTPHTMYLTFHTLLCLNKSVSLCLSLCLSQVTKGIDHESYLTMSTFIMNEGSSQAAPHHDMPCPFPATISLCPCSIVL